MEIGVILETLIPIFRVVEILQRVLPLRYKVEEGICYSLLFLRLAVNVMLTVSTKARMLILLVPDSIGDDVGLVHRSVYALARLLVGGFRKKRKGIEQERI